MAADDRFDAVLTTALHRYLDAGVGPHPSWQDAPARSAVDAESPMHVSRRRQGRIAALLIAAVLMVVILVVAAVAGGLFESPVMPGPTASLEAPIALLSPIPQRSPSAAPTVTSPSPQPVSTPVAPATPTCATSWSYRGTASPVGLTDGVRADEFDAGGGHLYMQFGHALDTVREISIVPAQPPFADASGRKVRVDGSAFFKLTLQGLNRPTQIDDDLRAGKLGLYRRTVGGDILEMRRIRKPKVSFPVNGPGVNSTEVWIIGLDRPQCLEVRTAGEDASGGDVQGTLDIDFIPVRPPRPTPASPSPSPSGAG